MLVKTTIEINGITYDHTYSDAGVMIEREGAHYSEAIDPLNSGREYTETDIPVEPVEEATEGDYQATLREMGVEV